MASPRLPKLPPALKRNKQHSYDDETALFVNCTEHNINYIEADGSITVIPTSGDVVRVTLVNSDVKRVGGFTLERIRHNGEIIGLPAPRPGTYFIVSALCKVYLRNRDDVVCPTKQIKSPDGSRVHGCRAFGH